MSERHPEDKFAIREGMLEGLPAVMIVNDALKNHSLKGEFPWHLWIEIEIENAGEVGLPDGAEAEVLNELEDEIHGRLKEACDVLFVGRMTWNSRRELFFYLDDPEAAHQTLQAIIAGEPVREFEYEMREDSGWEKVGFMYNYE